MTTDTVPTSKKRGKIFGGLVPYRVSPGALERIRGIAGDRHGDCDVTGAKNLAKGTFKPNLEA
jgi:hypothetical protein